MTIADLFSGLDRAPSHAQHLSDLRVIDTAVTIPLGNVAVGLDGDGHRHLLIPVSSRDQRDDIGAAVTIRTRDLNDGGRQVRMVDVCCTETRLDDLFSIVTQEMIEQVADDPGVPAFRTCQRVLDRWRELLRRQPAHLLGPEQLAGLAGELLWLNRLAVQDPDRALQSWIGPHGAPQDFVGPDIALEVKAETGSRSVEIHGLRQLEAPSGSSLYLAVVHLGPPRVDDSFSVPDLIDRALGRGIGLIALLERAQEAGYDHADRAAYDAVRWTLVGESCYEVDDLVPRISPSTTTYGGHAALNAVSYGLALDHLPPPLALSALDDVAGEIVTGPV